MSDALHCAALPGRDLAISVLTNAADGWSHFWFDGILSILATFSKQPGIALDAGGEWSGDVADFSGPTAYGVITVTDDAELRPVFSTDTRKFRCVRPLLG